MHSTTRRAISVPDLGRTDAPDIPQHITNLANVLDLDVPWYTGTEAAKPAAGTLVQGALYWATDSTILYINTGSWTALARTASPALTGTPTAPTPASTDNSTAIATTAFVRTMLPPGTITQYGGASAPTGWLLLDGSAVSRSTFSALFAIFGTTYGAGDGSTTFNLPDMRGRVPVGKNAATFATLGAVGGEETHALTVAELASHDHGAVTGATSAGTPAGTINAVSAGTPAGTLSSDSAGTPAGTLSSDSAGTPAGSINSVSAGIPSGTVSTLSANSGTESADHTHNYTPSGSVHSQFLNGTGALAENRMTTATTGASASDANAGDVFVQNTFTGNNANTSGRSAVHTHDISHSHTFTGSAMAGHSHTFTGSALGTHTHTFTGTALGTHTHTFTGTAMGTHSHTFTGTAMGTHTHSVSAQGGGAGHNNIQPYMVLNYIVKT